MRRAGSTDGYKQLEGCEDRVTRRLLGYDGNKVVHVM